MYFLPGPTHSLLHVLEFSFCVTTQPVPNNNNITIYCGLTGTAETDLLGSRCPHQDSWKHDLSPLLILQLESPSGSQVAMRWAARISSDASNSSNYVPFFSRFCLKLPGC